MLKNLVIGVAIVMMLMPGITFADTTAKEYAGNFTDSWQTATEYFKGAITQDQWQQALQTIRTPLGATISRKLKTKTYKTSLPGAPDGEYVVIQYESSFEHKISAMEIITTILDKDGKWRVAGYFIK
jgi:hypothetical protein